MLEIENLTKTFGTQTVISDISMTLVSGKIYGLVGRNGSGKTMLMKMILGFVSPSSGSIKIEGKVLFLYHYFISLLTIKTIPIGIFTFPVVILSSKNKSFS